MLKACLHLMCLPSVLPSCPGRDLWRSPALPSVSLLCTLNTPKPLHDSRPNFENFLYPYCPPHIERPKEVRSLYLVHLPEKCFFSVSPPCGPLTMKFEPSVSF